jgi:hypothetical protein
MSVHSKPQVSTLSTLGMIRMTQDSEERERREKQAVIILNIFYGRRDYEAIMSSSPKSSQK